MGACASTQLTSKGAKLCWQSNVNIIHLDGKLEQFNEPIKAEHALFQNPNCFLCSSESMYVGSLLPHVDPNEELQFDHIYFLMPLSKSHVPLSLHDLCALAIKANAALVRSELITTNSIMKSSSVANANCVAYQSLSKGYPH
ncbi:hypothetical protein RIF29_32233 [Crotalaria pallida]|uniref:Uncharacterized protein n=1 Tax=Crotalaria pallida TaxID=3830 RepID=A0AAN9EHW9_CROPI